MNNNRWIYFTVSFVALIVFFSGIIRHDVDESEYLELANSKQFDAVGQVIIDDSPGGSCVLIHDKFVLSAAHVFMRKADRVNAKTKNATNEASSFKDNKRVVEASTVFILIKGQKVGVQKIRIHPGYRDSATPGNYDLAILELESNFENILPVEINKEFDELGAEVIGVGYGASGIADQLESVSQISLKIAGQNVIDSVGGIEYLDKKTLLFCDFDHPTRNDCNRMGDFRPQPLEYITTGGDSGGPLFRQKNSKWELIGVCTGGGIEVDRLLKTGYYGQIMEWTRVSVFYDWINEHTE